MNGDMKMGIENSNAAERVKKRSIGYKILRTVVILFLCTLILGGGAALAYKLFTTGPRPIMKAPIKTSPLVRVQEVSRGNEQVIVKAMGIVIPARQIIIKSRLSGAVVSMHSEFTEGGFLKKGSVILRIDSEDYKLAIKQMESKVANAEYAMKLEMGQQDIARVEWEMISGKKNVRTEDAELALRKPHLEKAEADLSAAKADLEQAQLNLRRTKIRAPFNALVRSKNVDLGSQISTQDQLAELVGSDEYWIRVPIPMDRLKWIKIPGKKGEAGSMVRIYSGNNSESNHTHTGTVIKLLSDLENDGRMPRILVSVKDPLGLKDPGYNRLPLLLNQYVRVEIMGRELENVIRIPRASLRDNSKIWVLDDENKLRIRQANTIWRDDDSVILKDGFEAEERLIISDLPAPVDGLQLRTGSQDDQTETQTKPPSAAPFPGGGPPGGMDFMAQDANKDGKVSKDEFKGPAMFFKMFDKDGDGYVNEAEAPKGPPPGGGFPQG